jgi:hypothetical protein
MKRFFDKSSMHFWKSSKKLNCHHCKQALSTAGAALATTTMVGNSISSYNISNIYNDRQKL